MLTRRRKLHMTHSLRSFVKILFLPLENKIHIFARPCNILYVVTNESKTVVFETCFQKLRVSYYFLKYYTIVLLGMEKIKVARLYKCSTCYLQRVAKNPVNNEDGKITISDQILIITD